MGGHDTYLNRFVHEPERQVVHQLVSVLYSIGKLPYNPNHRRLTLRLVQRVQVLAQHRDDTLVLPRVPPEDVLDDDDGFLDYVCHFGLDELKEGFDASVRGGFHLDGDTTDRTHRFTHEVNVHFGGVPGCAPELVADVFHKEGNVLLKLCKDLSRVFFSCQTVHDFELSKLDVDRVVVLAKEHFDVVLEY